MSELSPARRGDTASVRPSTREPQRGWQHGWPPGSLDASGDVSLKYSRYGAPDPGGAVTRTLAFRLTGKFPDAAFVEISSHGETFRAQVRDDGRFSLHQSFGPTIAGASRFRVDLEGRLEAEGRVVFTHHHESTLTPNGIGVSSSHAEFNGKATAQVRTTAGIPRGPVHLRAELPVVYLYEEPKLGTLPRDVPGTLELDLFGKWPDDAHVQTRFKGHLVSAQVERDGSFKVRKEVGPFVAGTLPRYAVELEGKVTPEGRITVTQHFMLESKVNGAGLDLWRHNLKGAVSAQLLAPERAAANRSDAFAES